MFRHLRSKIILSFCVLMIAGGTVTTAVISRNLSKSLAESADRSGLAFARTLAVQLGEPLTYGDRLAVRHHLLYAQRTNPDIVYAFIVSPNDAVTDHSFVTGGFPTDLLQVAGRTTPTTIGVEDGTVRDLPWPIANGVLGTVHVGVSRAWVDRSTSESITNVLTTTALAALVGVLGILFLAGLITRPVLGLMGAAKRLGTGDHTARATVNGRDEIAGLAVTFNEMAEQIRERMAESEEIQKYTQRILDHVASGIVVISEDNTIEYANRVVTDGVGPLFGKKCSGVLSDQRPCAMCPVGEVLESGLVLHKSHTSESGRSYELTYVPMVGRDGSRSVVESSLDVTEQRQLVERVQRAERLAVAGEIAAGVVHTINNPLDGVRRAIELASKDPTNSERVSKMLSIAKEGTDRIVNVTHTLLGFARADASSAPVVVSVSSIVEEAVRLVSLKAQSNAVTIELELAPSLPPIRVDPQAIMEVFVNLLLNAVDACEDGGAITVETREAESSSVEILVTDDGVGISPEDMERIFEPFFTTKEVGRGTGLGLSVARRIVEAHQGEIELSRAADRGTTFCVRFPSESGNE